MEQYHYILKKVLTEGSLKEPARENLPSTISLFGEQIKYDLKEGFPLITTKKLNWKNIVGELLWFLKGDINIKYLVDNNINIWNQDAYRYYLKLNKDLSIISDHNFPNSIEWFIEQIKKGNLDSNPVTDFIKDYRLGDCGNQYGKVWRNLQYGSKKLGQIVELINGLQETPLSRRHILSSLDLSDTDNLALYPCHLMSQFNCKILNLNERNQLYTNSSNITNSYTHEMLDELNVPKYTLSCQLYQRSSDLFLGNPYNVASYSLLTYIIANICNMIPDMFIHTLGDVHLYENHIEQAKLQLSRDYTKYSLPTLNFSDNYKENIKLYNKKQINLNQFIENIKIDDFIIENYKYYPHIKAELSTGLNKI